MVAPDPREEAFAWFCGLEHFDLRGFDSWLASLPTCAIKAGLTEARAKACAALYAMDQQKALVHLTLMNERWRQERREAFLVPLARKAVKHGAAQSARRKDRPANNPDDASRNDRIRSFHARLVAENSSDATARTAVEFELSTRQVRRIVGAERP